MEGVNNHDLEKASPKPKQSHLDTNVHVVDYDDEKTALPAGTFDPVYEAKARVLNRAVRMTSTAAADW